MSGYTLVLFEYKLSVSSLLCWIYFSNFNLLETFFDNQNHCTTFIITNSAFNISTSKPFFGTDVSLKYLFKSLQNNTFIIPQTTLAKLTTYPYSTKQIKRTSKLIVCVFRKFLRSKGDRHYRN